MMSGKVVADAAAAEVVFSLLDILELSLLQCALLIIMWHDGKNL